MLTDEPGQPPWRTSNNAAAAATAAANEGRKVRINSKHIFVYDESTGEETANALHDHPETGKFGLALDYNKNSFLPIAIRGILNTRELQTICG